MILSLSFLFKLGPITFYKFKSADGVHISNKYNSMRFHTSRTPLPTSFIHVRVPSAKQLYYFKYFKMFSITA